MASFVRESVYVYMCVSVYLSILSCVWSTVSCSPIKMQVNPMKIWAFDYVKSIFSYLKQIFYAFNIHIVWSSYVTLIGH